MSGGEDGLLMVWNHPLPPSSSARLQEPSKVSEEEEKGGLGRRKRRGVRSTRMRVDDGERKKKSSSIHVRSKIEAPDDKLTHTIPSVRESKESLTSAPKEEVVLEEFDQDSVQEEEEEKVEEILEKSILHQSQQPSATLQVKIKIKECFDILPCF